MTAAQPLPHLAAAPRARRQLHDVEANARAGEHLDERIDFGLVTVVVNATDLAAAHGLSTWDSVVVSASAEAGCRLLLSEDLQDGFTWRGVTVTSPFAPSPHPLLGGLLNPPEQRDRPARRRRQASVDLGFRAVLADLEEAYNPLAIGGVWPLGSRPSSPGQAVLSRCCALDLVSRRMATMCAICYNPGVSRTITQRELRNDSAAVLREVEGGQVITVTRNGTPVAELRPIPPRRFVSRTAIAEAARRAPRVDLARLRADLDAVTDPCATNE